MEITGKLIKVLSPLTGTSAKGEWIKQDIVIETIEEWPKKICIGFWGKATDRLSDLMLGTNITAHINIESREYNERWYTEIRGWKWEIQEEAVIPPPEQMPDPSTLADYDDSQIPF